MPQVSILRREEAVQFFEPHQVQEMAAVTYSTPAVPPRTVHLPRGSYRPATAEELAASPRYKLLPLNEEMVQLERHAIEQDLHQATASPPTSFEL